MRVYSTGKNSDYSLSLGRNTDRCGAQLVDWLGESGATWCMKICWVSWEWAYLREEEFSCSELGLVLGVEGWNNFERRKCFFFFFFFFTTVTLDRFMPEFHGNVGGHLNKNFSERSLVHRYMGNISWSLPEIFVTSMDLEIPY